MMEEEHDMRLGVVFPQTEIGSDPAVIRDYAQAAESAGYDHLLVFDHVLGGKLERLDKLGGRRVSEQIAVMRKLWTEPVVTFKGSYHHLDRAGINPLPVQRPIPVWMGGMAEPVLKRVAQISDGWFPQFQPGDEASHSLDRVRAHMKDAGRPQSAVGIEGRFSYGIGDPTDWAKRAREWRDLGATHLSVNTMGAGLSPRGHIDAILKMKPALDGV